MNTVSYNTSFWRALVACAALAMLVPAVSFAADSDRPPNILFIAIDDLKAIGTLFEEEKNDFLQMVYPNPELRHKVAMRMTPNFDRLSEQGVTFMNAYCASSACVPSRAALMTGIRPHISHLACNEGGVFFRDWEFEGERPLKNAITLTELLKANGWYTAAVGKIFHKPDDYKMQDVERSWTDWTIVEGNAGRFSRSKWSGGLRFGREGDDNATFTVLNDYRAADFIARVLENGQATNGEETFALPADKPFFLACGIHKPHLPFVATKDLLDLFPVEEMTGVTRELLGYFLKDGEDLPPRAFRLSGYERDDDGDLVMSDDKFTRALDFGKTVDPVDGDIKAWKDMLMHYFASVATADRSLGRLLDGLGNSKYKDNTMVIFWSDHGYHLGEKLHAAKFTMWDDGARVPFIIKDPRNPQSAGAICKQPVSLVDIYPTVAAMAGVPLPDKRITGHDLSPLLKDAKTERDVPALQTWRRRDFFNAIRTVRYKLIQYDEEGTEIELYDIEKDPEEYTNLAKNPEMAEVVARLKERLQSALKAGESR